MKQFLIFTLMATHVLINCAWASAHMAGDFDNHCYESPHVHLYTLLSKLGDTDSDNNFSSHDHDDESHVHHSFYLFSIDSFNSEQTIVQIRSDIRIPFENLAFSPPVPPPTA